MEAPYSFAWTAAFDHTSKKDTTSLLVHVSLHTAIFNSLITWIHVGRTHFNSMAVTRSLIQIGPGSTPNVNVLIQIRPRLNLD